MNQTIIVILNTRINEKAFSYFYSENALVFCADGGANRLFQLNNTIKPQCIIGDLDSIKPEVKEFYSKQNTPIIKVDDQDTTDFQKVLLYIQDNFKNGYQILIFGGLTERLDQTMNSMSTMSQFKISGLMISDYGILRHFSQGEYVINLTNIESQKGICLCPVKNNARLNTQGLKWNIIQETPLIMGEFISTSNEALTKQIIVNSLDEFYFITTLNDEFIG